MIQKAKSQEPEEEPCLVSFRARLPGVATSVLIRLLGLATSTPPNDEWIVYRALDPVLFGPNHYPVIQDSTWGPTAPTGDRLPTDRKPYCLSESTYCQVSNAALAAIAAEIDERVPPRTR